MQLFFLLLITGAYVPEAIKIVISGANFALNPFESISFLESKNYNFMLRKLKYNINNSSLEVCELKSLSTVYNTFSFVIFIIYIIIVHVLIFVLRKILLNYQSTGKCRRLINVLKIFILKSYNILTFSLYIRMILEINEYFLISSLNEIYSFSAEHGDLIFSFIFSIFIILFSILLILLTIYLAFSSYQVDEESQNKLGEFFDGLKTSRICKMYPSLLLIRRLIFVVFCIVLQSAPSRVPIGILLPFQIGYLTLIAYSRPHQELIVNIVEIINESFFICLLGSLLIFNEERDWFEAIIYIFMHLILINVIICFFILQVYFMREICNTFSKKNKKIKPGKNNEQMQSMEKMITLHPRKKRKTPYPPITIGMFEESKEEFKVEEYDNRGAMVRTMINTNQTPLNLSP